MRALIEKARRIFNKENIRAVRSYIKREGYRGAFSACMNKIKYGKAVLDEYKAWMQNNEPTVEELEQQKKYESSQKTKFTLICEEKSQELEQSINEQTYCEFEVYYLDDIDLKSAVDRASGDHFVFIGKDIKLLPFTLYSIATYIEYHNCISIFSDNDKIKDGKRTSPVFKPDFAKDTIMSKNYIGNMFTVNAKFLKLHSEILQNLNKNFIYDLILNISERTNKIEHIQRVLYHELKDNIQIDKEDEKQIIEKHLKRIGLEYESIEDGKYLGQYKINYKLKEKPLISLVVPSKDHIDDLDKLLKSLEKSTYENYEVVIVENNSEQKETFEYYEKISKDNPKIKVVDFKIDYFNYSAVVNFGVKNSNGEYIVLLNNDIEFITPSWMEELLMYAQRPDVGICGMKLYFNDRSIQHAGVTLGIRGLAGHRYREVEEKDFKPDDYINIVQNLSAVTAACFMIRKQLYIDLLGFDEKLAVAFNDVDFCLKVRDENYLIVYNPFAEAYHYESKSRGQDDTQEKQKRFVGEYEMFVRRWITVMQKGDPYYNKNYRLDTDTPEINHYKINL